VEIPCSHRIPNHQGKIHVDVWTPKGREYTGMNRNGREDGKSKINHYSLQVTPFFS
jgi:hypothetical protein